MVVCSTSLQARQTILKFYRKKSNCSFYFNMGQVTKIASSVHVKSFLQNVHVKVRFNIIEVGYGPKIKVSGGRILPKESNCT